MAIFPVCSFPAWQDSAGPLSSSSWVWVPCWSGNGLGHPASPGSELQQAQRDVPTPWTIPLPVEGPGSSRGSLLSQVPLLVSSSPVPTPPELPHHELCRNKPWSWCRCSGGSVCPGAQSHTCLRMRQAGQRQRKLHRPSHELVWELDRTNDIQMETIHRWWFLTSCFLIRMLPKGLFLN